MSSLEIMQDPALSCQCLETGKLDLSGEDMAEERAHSFLFPTVSECSASMLGGHAVSCDMLRGRRCWLAAQLYLSMLG